MKNKESRAEKIRELVLDILSDGQIHTTKEIMDIAVEKKLIQDKNTDIIYNILFHMKKKGVIAPGPDKAQYVICNMNKSENENSKKNIESKEQQGAVILNLDPQKYSLLQPMPGRYSRMTLMVKENGELRMNGTLLKKIKERDVEIFISKDLRNIVLNPSGANTHKFTKAGTTKNRELVSMLKRMKIKLPVFYVVTWNESIGAWEGILDISEKV